MKRINPIYLLIALNVILILFRDVFLAEETNAAIGAWLESFLMQLGPWGYAGILAAWFLCGFFLVPLLVPLNILGGALYGPLAGTAVALAGIVAATIASLFSVRRVFTGIQPAIENRPSLRRAIAAADRHANLSILLVRFSVIVPHMLQNIALAATNMSALRITLLTAVSAIPGAAIYSLLGAGLLEADNVNALLLYVLAPILLMLTLSAAIVWFNRRAETDRRTDC